MPSIGQLGIGLNKRRGGGQQPVLILDESGNAIMDAETGAIWVTYTDDIDED